MPVAPLLTAMSRDTIYSGAAERASGCGEDAVAPTQGFTKLKSNLQKLHEIVKSFAIDLPKSLIQFSARHGCSHMKQSFPTFHHGERENAAVLSSRQEDGTEDEDVTAAPTNARLIS